MMKWNVEKNPARRPSPKRLSALASLMTTLLFVGCSTPALNAQQGLADAPAEGSSDYAWTTDHMQVGVRWQPFGRPENDAADGRRAIITEDSSYAQFWVAWSATEPTEASTDYAQHKSGYLQAIEQAVDACNAEGLKVELVLWHAPAWATVSGESGPWKSRPGEYANFARRLATHFKGRVHAYQMYHEANVEGMLQDGGPDHLIHEVFTRGAEAVRSVYDAAPAEPVFISTSGMSPCEACPSLAGLAGKGAVAANDFYDRMIADSALMDVVDALNLNVSDHFNGYGLMDGSIISSVWGNYDLVRNKLNAAGYPNIGVQSSESWIVWDDATNANDVNGDGLKNEQDAYSKALTIIGRCMERGLNTLNMPWSDNSSGWAMGLTKRLDYNGRVKKLRPDLVIPASDGGPDVVTRKMTLRGRDDNFIIEDGGLQNFTIDDYINPADPNHLHYYIWKWFSQIAGASDEVIRHAMAGEVGNDIIVWGPGFTGAECYRLSSYNRTKNQFTVLIHSGGANGTLWSKVSIPAAIQNGAMYNNEYSRRDFRGEGFAEGDKYRAHILSHGISQQDGSAVGRFKQTSSVATVTDGMLTVTVGKMHPFTTIQFTRVP